MKLRAIIREEVKPQDKTIIVEFSGDEKKQDFEIKCLFSPFYKEMKKWDVWELNVKMESEIFTEPKTGQKSYFTHLICKKAELLHTHNLTEKDWQSERKNKE